MTKPWSLAETHCAVCGRMFATPEDENRHDDASPGGTCRIGCWCESLCWRPLLGGHCSPDLDLNGRMVFDMNISPQTAAEIRRLDEQLATAREMLLAIDVEAAHIGISPENELRPKIRRLIFEAYLALVSEAKSLEDMK